MFVIVGIGKGECANSLDTSSSHKNLHRFKPTRAYQTNERILVWFCATCCSCYELELCIGECVDCIHFYTVHILIFAWRVASLVCTNVSCHKYQVQHRKTHQRATSQPKFAHPHFAFVSIHTYLELYFTCGLCIIQVNRMASNESKKTLNQPSWHRSGHGNHWVIY